MTKFAFEAVNADGKIITGKQVANTSTDVHRDLTEHGLQPIRVRPRRSIWKFEITKKKVPRKQVMHFSRQLAVFLTAGIAIIEALEVIGQETSDKVLQGVIKSMVESLRSGDTFAVSAGAHPEAFPAYYVGLLNSAELTGNLDTVLNQLSDYIERDSEARRRLTSALVYPGVVLAMSIVTVVVLAVFVLPRFETFFSSLHATLPLPTRLLLSSTGFVSHYGEFIGGAIVVGIFGFLITFRSTRGRAIIDAACLRIPVVGDLWRDAIVERVCRILASMLGAGVPLPEAMTVAADAVNNTVYRRGLTAIRAGVLEGQGLAGPLANSGLFAGAARQIFRVGEETGTLDGQLKTAATYYDRELDYKVKRFTNLFEPAVIIIMGVVVGFVAVALVSAMYGIYKQVKVT